MVTDPFYRLCSVGTEPDALVSDGRMNRSHLPGEVFTVHPNDLLSQTSSVLILQGIVSRQVRDDIEKMED